MRKKILVVDDEPDVLAIFKKKLDAYGFNTIIAQDGVEGLEQAKKEIPDLILLDIIMPKKDGFTLLKELWQEDRTREIPVVMVSGKSESDFLFQGQHLGAVDYLIKPVDFQELLKFVRKYT
jgi:DNA-binding response OmpR family regulator